MTSGDKTSLFGIPSAWILKESGLAQSLTVSITPPSSKRSAYIGTLDSPAPPTSYDPPLPPSSPISIYSTPRAPYHAPNLSGPEHRIKEATFTMQFSSKEAAGVTPQVSSIQNLGSTPRLIVKRPRFIQNNTLSSFDDSFKTSSVTLLHSPSPQVLSHETGTSSGSALNRPTPTAQEAHDQTLLEEIPAPHRQIVQLEVRNGNGAHRSGERGTTAGESFSYRCESLPYTAGLRPHAYVDNHEYATRSKRDLAEDLFLMDEFTEEEEDGVDKSKRPKFFRRLFQRKKASKLMMPFSLPNSRKSPTPSSVDSRATDPRSPAVSALIADPAGHCPGTANHPTGRLDRPPTPTSPPPPYSTVSHQPTNLRSSKSNSIA